MAQSLRPRAVGQAARAWRALPLLLVVVLVACGGGSGSPGADAAGSPSAAGSGPPAPTSPPAPGRAAALVGTWTVVFTDAAGEATPRALSPSGQLAYTSVGEDGPRARLFDGSTVHELPGQAARAVAANDAGQVTGHFEFPFGVPRAFRWAATAGDAPARIDLAPEFSSQGHAINAGGTVAATIGRRGFLAGARWAPGLAPQALELRGPADQALFINTPGAIAGVSDLPGRAQHATFWRPSNAAIDVGTLGGNLSEPAGLNDAGQVAGRSATAGGSVHAFLWSEATGMRDLGTLGGPTSAATGLNASGWVVGAADTSDGATVAFLWRDGSMVPLGSLGGRASAAAAINAAGLVAGNAETATGVQHAFVWTAGTGMVDLNERIAGDSPGVMQSVVALADDGTVLALAGTTLVLLRPVAAP